MKRTFYRYQRMRKNDIRSSYVSLWGTRVTGPLGRGYYVVIVKTNLMGC